MDAKPAVACALLGLLLAGPHAGAETRPPYGGDIVAPLLSEPVSLDPVAARSHAEVSVVDLVCDTLYEIDLSGKPVPRLAAGPPVVGEKGRLVRIPLRAGVVFHGGDKLTAADVARSLERARKSKSAGWLLAPVKRAIADGDDVVLELERKAPELASLLAAPATAVTPGGAAPRGDRLVGTGPFSVRLVDRKRGRIVLDANDDYAGGRSYVDVIELRWYDNDDAEAKAYEAGNSHVSFRGAVAFAGHQPKYATADVTGPATVLAYVGFGTEHDDIVGNRHFRRALSLAIDRDSFRSVGTGEPVSAAVAPAAPALGGKAPRAGERVARTAAARRELARAAREVASLRDGPPTFEILVDESRPDDAEVGKKVQAALFRLDLKARVKAVSARQLARRARRGDTDLYVGQLAAPCSDPALEIAAAFAAGGNGWAARTLAKRRLDEDALRGEFEDQLPVVPLFHRAIRAHHRKSLGGVSFDVLGRLSLADVFVFTSTSPRR